MPDPRPLTPVPGAPTLVIGFGNPDRGDDALGPLLAGRLEAAAPAGVEVLADYQLQIEHTLDLRHRRRVIFADASTGGAEPYAFLPLAPAREAGYSTHALSPATLLFHFGALFGPPPEAFLLAMRGHAFELGAPLSAAAARNLEAALHCLLDFLDHAETRIADPADPAHA